MPKKIVEESDKNSESLESKLDEIKALVEENVRYTKTFKRESEARENQLQTDLKELLEKNLEISKELHSSMKKINHWVAWQKVWGGVVKLLILLVPIILGIIYLPPLLKELFEPYQQLLNISGSMTGGNEAGNLLQQLKDTLGNGTN